MKKKKALIVTEVFFPENFVINQLADDWLQDKLEFEVLTRNPSYPKAKVYKGYKNSLYSKGQYGEATVHRIPFTPNYDKSVTFKMISYISYIIFSFIFLLLKGNRYNRVFIYQTGPLTNALSVCFFKFFFKYKITLWVQDLWPQTVFAFGFKKTKGLTFFLNTLVGFIYRRCDFFLISCRGFESTIKSYLEKKQYCNIKWVPNWSLLDKDTTVKKIKLPGVFNFTFAGNVGKVQNLENVLLAYKDVSKVYKDVYLNIIGDGSNLDRLKELVEIRSILNVNFTGRKPLEDMSSYFECSDVLLLSLVDAEVYNIMIPSKFQSYLAASKPIFAVMNGEVSNLVNDYNIGFSSNPSDLKGISRGFMRFLELEESEYHKMSLRSKELLEKDFNKEILINKINKLFWL